MDAKQFVAVLRKIVKEEVRQVVREELRSALVESKKLAPGPTKLVQARPPISRTQPSAPKPIKKFGGPVGNILNETMMSMMSNPSAAIPDPIGEEEWPSMGGSTFTTNHLGDPELNGFDPEPATPPILHPSGDPTMAFVRDYSAVVKRAEQISNSR